MVRMAGNTSPWEDSTMLTSVARFNAEITYESLLVHAGSRNASKAHNSATYEKDKWSSSRAQHLPAGFTTLTNSKSWRNQKRSSWKYCMHTRQPLRGGYNALEYLSNSIGVVPRKEPCPSAGNHAALPPAKELEKMLPRHQGALVFISFIHLEQMGVKESGKHMFPLQFIQKKKPNLWVLGFSFKVPVPRFRIPGSGSLAVHLTRRKSNGVDASAFGQERDRLRASCAKCPLRCPKVAKGMAPQPRPPRRGDVPKFITLINGMISDCDSEVEHLTEGLAELQEALKRIEAMLKSTEDAHAAETSQLEF
ncbi:hypothetical protein F2Q70_00038694 [Brassica cretica]|uniref:Uncharacterized protein n=1 Tax=Brassica cretica TaxID=69181 RepID=A0A8S9K9N2_BRACR|nr:hypothetical protein F2Q70_00038694 [Brassica cretica]